MLVEREAELNTLFQEFQHAEKRQGRVVLISGEAGIGKSTLVSAFRIRTIAEGVDVHWIAGGCEALFTPRTLGPIHDMANELGRTIKLALDAAGNNQSVICSALLSALDTSKPSVMVVEDLHWADHATLDVLKYLARRTSDLPLLLILTFRDDEVDVGHPLTQLLGDLPMQATCRLALEPLSYAGVELLGQDSELSADNLYRISGGNPYYVHEIMNACSDRIIVPASVKDTVSLRLGRLEPCVRESLERISVRTSPPTYDFMDALFGDEAPNIIGQCVATGFLIETQTGVRFRHELTRLATVQRITPVKLRANHKACLRVLLEIGHAAALDEIVHHAAGAFDAENVLKYAPKAAEAAVQAGGHHEAAAHYATALRFIDNAEPGNAAQLYESWAYESALADQMGEDVIEARRHAITLWRALGRLDKVGHNLRHLSRIHWYRGESSEAIRLADQTIDVLESIPMSHERAMAYSMKSQLHMLNDQMEDAIAWGHKALECEGELPDIETRVHALNNIGTAKIFRGDVSGRDDLQRSLSLALSHALHEHPARAYNNLGEFAVEFRDFKLAERTLLEGISYDNQNDLDAWTHYLSGRLAQLRMEQGRLDEAIAISESVIALENLSLTSKLPGRLVTSRAHMRRGDDFAENIMLDALSASIATGELQHIVPARLTMVEWAWLTDRPYRASAHMQRLLELSTNDRHPWNIGSIRVWANRFGFPPDCCSDTVSPEPYELELNGDFEGAAKAWDALGSPYEAALVRLRLDTEDALDNAAQSFAKMGANLGLQKAERLAEREGVTLDSTKKRRGPYQASRSHPLGLTAKEQVVLRHLSEGRSNKEIAEELNRSQRTVEHHVSAILGKLDAPNRMAAILRVQQEPWLQGKDTRTSRKTG